MTMTSLILAGGQGTRMKSPLPKVLHPVAGRPMIVRSIESCLQAGVKNIRVVVGHGQNLVKTILDPYSIQTYVQESQLGTADAVNRRRVDNERRPSAYYNGRH
jgi:bifunctional UDP-N-acetylglucosamine pyrophosphorylase/glucosamine-1-phosphate N-acetyltransferase